MKTGSTTLTEGDISPVLAVLEPWQVPDFERRLAVRVHDLRRILQAVQPSRVDKLLHVSSRLDSEAGQLAWRKTRPYTLSVSSLNTVLKMTVTRSWLAWMKIASSSLYLTILSSPFTSDCC